MLYGGDELGNTQKGNNNVYCQDSELAWLHWELNEDQKSFLTFVKKVIRLWRTQPVFQRRTFFKGRAIRGSDIKDISFLNPAGKDMSDEDWNAGYVKCMGVRLAGDLIGDENERGEPIVGDTLLLLLNAHHEPVSFTLPLTKVDQYWELLFDTDDDNAKEEQRGQKTYLLKDRSMSVWTTRTIGETRENLAEVRLPASLQGSNALGP
jgi:glycogen operon protein